MDARRLLQRIRDSLRWVTLEVWFYNLDNYRPDAQVARELRAIARLEPAAITLCEVIGNELPELDGYTLVADRSTRSRENIAAYVRHGFPLRRPRWLDLTGTWPRTEGPGIHEARSFLVQPIGLLQLLVGHQAPKNARNAWTLQHEGVAAAAAAMAPWTRDGWRKRHTRAERIIARLRPRLLVWDGNRRSGEAGPGPDSLALRIGGTVHGGERIDHAVARGSVEVTDVEKFGRVGGVELESDHHGAVRFRLRVRAIWLRRRP